MIIGNDSLYPLIFEGFVKLGPERIVGTSIYKIFLRFFCGKALRDVQLQVHNLLLQFTNLKDAFQRTHKGLVSHLLATEGSILHCINWEYFKSWIKLEGHKRTTRKLICNSHESPREKASHQAFEAATKAS